jgi:hypothetical protein
MNKFSPAPYNGLSILSLLLLLTLSQHVVAAPKSPAPTYATKDALDQEVTDRQTGDSTEVSTRVAADANLQSQIDALKAALTKRKIGDTGPGGGIIFFVDDESMYPFDYLEAAADDLQGSVWGCSGTTVSGAEASGVGSGQANTQAMIVAGCGGAAAQAAAYRGGGFSDWSLPSKEELGLMYTNLAEAGKVAFGSYYYWSSTEDLAGSAWGQAFYNFGLQGSYSKDAILGVRPVRAF